MNRLTLLPLLAVIGLSLGCPKAPKPVETPTTFDNRNTNSRPGDGALVGSARAGKRALAMHDMDQMKTFIFAYELDNNRMPTKEELRIELKNAANLLKLIDEGVVLFPSQMQKNGLWAYEIDADKVGGIVMAAGTVRRATADEVKTLLGQK